MKFTKPEDVKVMNRKGFLLGETTLKMVIAVIAILLLIFLLYGLYKSFSDEDEMEKADAALIEILERVGKVSQDSNVNELRFYIPNPKGWNLVYFSKGNPISCGGTKCLCICKDEEDCNDSAVCKRTSRDIILNEFIEIEPTEILIKAEGDSVLIKRYE